MKLSLFLAGLILFTSCAHQSGTPSSEAKAKTDTKRLKINIDAEDEIGQGHYRLYTFSLYNPSQEWKRIKSARIEFMNGKINDEAKIIIGNDLVTWLNGMSHERNVSYYNKYFILSGLVTLTALLSGVSRSEAASRSYAYGTLAGFAGLVGSASHDQKKWTEIQRQVPDNHLLSSFSVPPYFVTQKWIALEYHGKENTDLKGKTLKLILEFLDGEKDEYLF